MKTTITTAVLLILTISVSAQKKNQPDPQPNTVTITMNENQIGAFYQLMEIAKAGFYETDVTGKQIKALSGFADSCERSWQSQYAIWHPAPPPPQPKADSTSAPKK